MLATRAIIRVRQGQRQTVPLIRCKSFIALFIFACGEPSPTCLAGRASCWYNTWLTGQRSSEVEQRFRKPRVGGSIPFAGFLRSEMAPVGGFAPDVTP